MSLPQVSEASYQQLLVADNKATGTARWSLRRPGIATVSGTPAERQERLRDAVSAWLEQSNTTVLLDVISTS
jgi:hypothetical protein